MKKELYSLHSRHIGVFIVPCFLVTAICAALAGWLYAWLDTIMPWAILDLLPLAVMAIALMAAVAGCLYLARCPNVVAAAIVAVLIGAVAWYGQFAAWEHFVLATQGNGPDWLALLMHPGKMWAIATEIAQKGTWSLFGSACNGFMLYLCWFLEACTFLLCSALGIMPVLTFTFSESAKQWCKNQHGKYVYRLIEDTEAFVRRLESNPDDLPVMLAELGAPQDPHFYTEVFFQSCDKADTAYLFVQNTTHTFENGQTDWRKDGVAEGFIVTRRLMETTLASIPAGQRDNS